MKKAHWAVDTFLACALTVLAGTVFQRHQPYGLLWNATPSIPRGLYVSKDLQEFGPVQRGELVCWRYAPTGWLVERGYSPPGVRVCKPVAGVPGDAVRIEEDQLYVTPQYGQEEAAGRIAKLDSKGRTLPNALAGLTHVPSGTVLVVAPQVNALDSRYVGPVPRAALTTSLRPLWTY